MEAGANPENENNQENIGERQENLQQEANANVNVVDENEERRELIEPQKPRGECRCGYTQRDRTSTRRPTSKQCSHVWRTTQRK